MSDAFSASGATSNTGLTLPPPGSVPLPHNATRAQIDQYIAANFGYEAWALAIPELRTILEKAVGPNGLTMDQNTFAGAVRNTSWFKNNTQAMRSWVQLQGEDPATAQAQLKKQSADLQNEATNMGLTLNPNDLMAMSEQAIAYQWDRQMMDRALYSEAMRQTFQGTAQGGVGETANTAGNLTGSPFDDLEAGGGKPGDKLKTLAGDPFGGGTLSDYYSKVMALADTYMVPISPTTATQWAIALATGQTAAGGVEGSIRKMAMGAFPTLATQIEGGLTPKALFQPLQQTVATTLEMAPDQVDWRTPQFSQLMHFTDPTTQTTRPMTISEAGNWARTQPQWAHTQNFQAADATMAKTLATSFGEAKF